MELYPRPLVYKIGYIYIVRLCQLGGCVYERASQKLR